MPGRRRGSYGRGMAPIITSIKNVPNAAIGVTSATSQMLIAKAVTAPSPTVSSDVSHGCIIRAIWVSFDMCGLGATGVLNNMAMYLMKNPGDNLTAPAAFSVGTSNEKKFVFRQWFAMMMRNQDGNPPFHWEGWIKIPKRYQRMGTDDTISLFVTCTASQTGHASMQCVYKWYR